MVVGAATFCPAPLSPCAPTASPVAHLAAWLQRRGAHLARQMWLHEGGSSPVVCFCLPLCPLSLLWLTIHPGLSQRKLGRMWVFSPAMGLGWGESSVHGAQASPELVRACFLLVVLSCEGGRTIWSSPCQPNKIRNAGQALQIPLTAAGQCGAVSGQGLTHLSPYTEPGVMAEEPCFLLGAAGLGQSAWAGVP